MESKVIANIARRGRNMSFTGIFVALSVGILLPVLLSTAVGIVTLAMGESSNPIVVGVLVISFTAAAIGSAVTVTVLLGRKANTARLQADLLTNVTHDLRTPLSAIRMYAQTLQSGKVNHDPQRFNESLLTIIRETEWLESMIDRVLTWRAAAKDQHHLKLESLPLRNAVDEAVQRFGRMVAPGEVELSVSINSTALVLHDPHGICAMLLNLLINAYKYTGREKKISVRVEDLKRQVSLSVEDNGIGIPAKEMQRIFEPFYRVDTRLRSQASGAGLGLAIVRHLVKSHDGEVQVESKEGQGSRFTMLLPKAPLEDRRP